MFQSCLFGRSLQKATKSLHIPSIKSFSRTTTFPNKLNQKNFYTSQALLIPLQQQSSSNNNTLKYGLTMAFMAALLSNEYDQNNNEKGKIKCSEMNSFNFIADAAAIASPAVVNVVVNLSAGGLIQGQASGSGFIIDSSGLVATNAHVVANALHRGSALTVTLNDGRKFNGKVHSLDRQLDIALIQLDLSKLSHSDNKLPVASIGHSSDMRAGEWVVALGSPLRLQNTVTAGILSSIARGASEIGLGDQSYEYLQTDAAINQGNSGGPLVNLNGEVIGINTAKLGGNLVSGISFAIPMDIAWQVIQQLRKYGNVRRPYLGIKFVTSNRLTRYGRRHILEPFPSMDDKLLKESVTIAEVLPNSPAELAGLKEGDVIIEFDHRKVNKMRDIIERLGYEYGRSIEIKVKRKDQELTLNVISSKPKQGR